MWGEAGMLLLESEENTPEMPKPSANGEAPRAIKSTTRLVLIEFAIK
jgi:hypothetical protein